MTDALKRARDFLEECEPTPEELANLLEAWAQEARLEEAIKWQVNWNVDDTIRDFGTWANERIAALEQRTLNGTKA
jgi:hypothetical protein